MTWSGALRRGQWKQRYIQQISTQILACHDNLHGGIFTGVEYGKILPYMQKAGDTGDIVPANFLDFPPNLGIL